MGRRSKSIFEELFELPWWASVVFAALVFVLLRWVGPAMTSTSSVPGKLFHDVAIRAAPVVALLFLIPAPFSLLRSWRRGTLLGKARDADTIRDIPWNQFEALIATAFQRIGYEVEERGGSAPDGGIDLVLHEG